MPITTGVKQLVDAAEREIESLSLAEAKAMLGGEEAVFVDIRDIRELQREGKIKGAIHAPLGMLEFSVDPASPYHRDAFAQEKTYVLYCASAWRSALATQALQNMGMDNVCHIAGGFTAWKAAELPMEPVPVKAD